jgi:hypothetical protein
MKKRRAPTRLGLPEAAARSSPPSCLALQPRFFASLRMTHKSLVA